MTFSGSTRQYDAPASDPNAITVAIGPLAAFDQRKRHRSASSPAPKPKPVMCFMEMRMTVNAGDASPGIMVEQPITVVKRLVGNNRQWNAIAIDTKVTGTEVDLTTYADRSALAVMMIEVQYR